MWWVIVAVVGGVIVGAVCMMIGVFFGVAIAERTNDPFKGTN